MLRQKVCMTAAILWMVIIFCFSARPAEVSTKDSNGIGMLIGKLCISDFSEWSEEEQMNFAKKIDHPVRKTAHAAEYAVLGMLLVGSFVKSEKKGQWKTAGVAWALGTFYAATDEFHQLFVSGRSGQISDVILDSTGVMAGVGIGIGLLWLLGCVYRCNISKKLESEERV